MKISKKKSVFAFGTVAAMATPISLVVACSNGGDNWDYDSSKKIFDDKTGKQFSEDIKDFGGKEDASMTQLEKNVARFMYKREQVASKNTQISEFKWSIHKIEMNIIKSLNDIAYFKDGDTKKDVTGLGNTLPGVFDLQKAIRNKDTKSVAASYIEWSKKIQTYVGERKDKILDLAEAHNKDDKSFKKNYDNLKKIKDNLDLLKNDKVNYEANDFSTNFSKLLQPIDKIKERQTKILDDIKDGVVSASPTKAEGQEKWAKERTNKYGGASSDKKAIDYLVLQQIKRIAFLSRKISIIHTYTREQLLWSNVENGFSFLKDINAFGSIENDQPEIDGGLINETKKTLSDKIWYYGTKSNLVDQKVLKNNFSNWTSSLVTGRKFKLIRHALMIVKPDAKGETLPWVADQKVIKKMFSFKPVKPGEKISNHAFQDIEHIFENVDINGIDSDSSNKYTEDFIKGYSDNGGSRSNMGSLGILRGGAVANGMNNGFSLGMLSAETTTNGNLNSVLKKSDDDIYKKIQLAIKKAYLKTMINPNISDEDLNKVTINSPIQDDIRDIREFTQRFTKISDDPSLKARMIKTFGTLIRDAFGAKDGRKLVYTNGSKVKGKQRYVVTSTNGIHFVASYDFDSANSLDIGNIVKSEVKRMAKKKTTSAAQYSLDKFFTNRLTINDFYKELLNGKDPIGIEFVKEFKAYLGTLNKKNDLNNETPDQYIANVLKQLDRILDSKAGIMANRYAQKNTKWLIGQFDTKMIKNTVLDPDTIYKQAFIISGGTI